jgi:hypothetical protein
MPGANVELVKRPVTALSGPDLEAVFAFMGSDI